MPYKKRTSINLEAINDDFIKEIADVSTELQDPTKKSVVMVMQAVVNGGVYPKIG